MNQETSIAIKITKQSAWQKAEALGLPAAMWKLPNDSSVHLIVGQESQPLHDTYEAFRSRSGFSIAQFLNDDKTLFIPSDYHLVFNENEQPKQQIGQTLNISQAIENLFQKEDVKLQNTYSKSIVKNLYEAVTFETMVQKAIAAIKSGQMQKVVLSRTKQVELSKKFELIEGFNELCGLYPTAFISLVSLPHLGQVWMGASPETLVSQNAQGIFKTMALAGTQSAFDGFGRKIETHDAMWRQKEIEEQAYVSRYIIDCFKKIRLREFDEEGPKTVVAGNLMHLKTDFIVDAVKANMPELLEVMLRLLHPTSAVCGMPKEPATAFIEATELHDRQFYSGFLGPVNIANATHLFVNLRTMCIEQNIATLFAGCGITEFSNPQKEWLETEMKSQTMMKIVK